jgi:hypothetical protein
VESDCLGLHLSLLRVDLVPAEDDWDVLANTDQVNECLLVFGFVIGGRLTYGASVERSCM